MASGTTDLSAPYIMKDMSRREALRALGMGAFGASTFFTAMTAAAPAAAFAAGDDYRALVCIYLGGGNDQSNTIVPASGAEYAAYYSARPELALAQDQLLAIMPDGYNGPLLGLNPALPGIRSLFQDGRAAILSNVGTLTYPVTRDEYNAALRPLPIQLYSHSDQLNSWQTGLPDRPSATGWLGRIGDLVAAGSNDSNAFAINMSTAGNNDLQVGQQSVQYQVTTQGPVRINSLYGGGFFGDPRLSGAVRQLMTGQRTNILERALTSVNERAIESETRLSAALASARPITTPFPATGLGAQARMVAQLIAANAGLGQKRQMFYMSSGGWDFHDNLTEDHVTRLAEVDSAVVALHNATVELGLDANVTTFTTSEFGRALQSNGRGSDHGWGGHHFIVGGAVRGRQVYGQFPDVALEASQDAGQGRLIPTTSVDQYASTLALWFGVQPDELAMILPNLGRFETPDLGFLAA